MAGGMQGLEFAHLAKQWAQKNEGFSHSLNFGEGPERFAHLAHQKRENEQIFKKTYKKTFKNVQTNMILFNFFWLNCSFFVSKRANEQFVKKN